MLVTAVTTYLLMPFNINKLGTENYGVWIIISSLTAYLFMLHLGTPMASVREMTQAIATKDHEKLNRVVASCAALYVGAGLAVLVLGLPLLWFFETHYVVAADLKSEARLTFVLAVLQTGLAFLATMPYAIFSAYEHFILKNWLMIGQLLIRAALNLVLVLWYPGFLSLSILMLVMSVVELLLCWGYVFKSYPEIRPKPHHATMQTVKDIFGFSLYVFLMVIGSQLAFQTSPLIVGYFMTNADVPSVAVPNALMLILTQFIGGIAAVIMPVATNLQSLDKSHELQAVFLRWSKVAVAVSICACLFLIVFGPAFLKYWIGNAYATASGDVLQILAVSYLIFLPARGVAMPILMGLGNAKWPTIATLISGVLNLVLSVWWANTYGLLGVAWGMAIPNIVLAVALTFLACRELKIPLRTYVAQTVPLALIGGISLYLLLALVSELWHPTSFFGLGFAGILTVGLCGLMWTEMVLRNDAHLRLPRVSDLLRGRFA